MSLRRSAFVAVSVASTLAVLGPSAAQDAADGASRGRGRAPTLGAVYPADRTHSALTPAVVAHLRAIASRGDLEDDVFMKVGASATATRNFMRCFSGPHVSWGEHVSLRATWRHFSNADRVDPYRRVSGAAHPGWHAGRAIWGDPPPLVREWRALDPRFAVVMYGTNDIEIGRPHVYARLMRRLVDMLTQRGVIPILTTIMPRDDDPEADRMVPLYNAIVRAVAQSRRLPLIDYHRELSRLPDHGISSDGVHPNVYLREGEPRGCDFTPEGLAHGYNLRNLLTLQALDRLRRHVLQGEAAPDTPAPPPPGRGTPDAPFVIGALPFAHASDTSAAPSRVLDRYRCGDQDESGAEVVYRLTLEAPAEVYALASADEGVDVDLHRLRDGRCLERTDEHLALALPAGIHDLVVDTFVDRAGRPRAGRYLFVLARTDQPSVAAGEPRALPTRPPAPGLAGGAPDPVSGP